MNRKEKLIFVFGLWCGYMITCAVWLLLGGKP